MTENFRCPRCGAVSTDSGHRPGLYDDSSAETDAEARLRLCELYWAGTRYQVRLSYSEAETEARGAL